MSYRGQRSGAYEGRNSQAPGMMWHGPPLGIDPSGRRSSASHSLELAEKIAAQDAEINRLDGDNRRLASMQVILRQELVDSQREIQGLAAHIRSTESESDIQIRVLLDKTAQMEQDIRTGPNLRKELQQAHADAQSLVAASQDLSTEILMADRELEKVNADIKILPELLAEHDSLKQEHQKLCAEFELEKAINVKEVKEMEEMEKDLVNMVREAEKLRTELINVKQKTHVPHSGAYMNPFPAQPPPQSIQTYGADYVIPHFQAGAGIGGDNMLPVGTSYSGVVPGPPHMW